MLSREDRRRGRWSSRTPL